jgi:hypothetical protein
MSSHDRSWVPRHIVDRCVPHASLGDRSAACMVLTTVGRSWLNHRVVRGLYTIMVCVIVMLAVPVSQLRLVSTRVECCCPDQKNCHCPDHDTDAPSQTSIKACHKSSSIVATADAPAVAVSALDVLDAPTLRSTSVEFSVSQPHEPPSPSRPPGPS